ncbi:hypothetical protein E2C01_071838 [Portunus trituberculatus]|uniref:Uncharacterized protein n=1 Tax=Portunus trituberculatus TaxID=210409 RepID=A0A5B7I648_PORTR|nr:hypothetical protein [Portunus trituberculatus]
MLPGGPTFPSSQGLFRTKAIPGEGDTAAQASPISLPLMICLLWHFVLFIHLCTFHLCGVYDVVSAFLGGAASVRSQSYPSIDVPATTSSLRRIIVSWIQCLDLMGDAGTWIEECGGGRCTVVTSVCWSAWGCLTTSQVSYCVFICMLIIGCETIRVSIGIVYIMNLMVILPML